MRQTFLNMKRQARSTVNETLGEQAQITRRGEIIAKDFLCRFWTKFANIGDLKGTNYHFSSVVDNRPRVILPSAVANLLKRHDMIEGVESGRKYLIDIIEPNDDTETTAYLMPADSPDTPPSPSGDEFGSPSGW